MMHCVEGFSKKKNFLKPPRNLKLAEDLSMNPADFPHQFTGQYGQHMSNVHKCTRISHSVQTDVVTIREYLI